MEYLLAFIISIVLFSSCITESQLKLVERENTIIEYLKTDSEVLNFFKQAEEDVNIGFKVCQWSKYPSFYGVPEMNLSEDDCERIMDEFVVSKNSNLRHLDTNWFSPIWLVFTDIDDDKIYCELMLSNWFNLKCDSDGLHIKQTVSLVYLFRFEKNELVNAVYLDRINYCF